MRGDIGPVLSSPNLRPVQSILTTMCTEQCRSSSSWDSLRIQRSHIFESAVMLAGTRHCDHD